MVRKVKNLFNKFWNKILLKLQINYRHKNYIKIDRLLRKKITLFDRIHLLLTNQIDQ